MIVATLRSKMQPNLESQIYLNTHRHIRVRSLVLFLFCSLLPFFSFCIFYFNLCSNSNALICQGKMLKSIYVRFSQFQPISLCFSNHRSVEECSIGKYIMHTCITLNNRHSRIRFDCH